MIGNIAFGMCFALLGGFVAAWLTGVILSATVSPLEQFWTLGAAISLLNTMGKGALWSQVAALALMAPCAVLGGWLRLRQVAGA